MIFCKQKQYSMQLKIELALNEYHIFAYLSTIGMKKHIKDDIFIENKDEETNACQNINYICLKTYSFVTEFVC